MLARNAVTKIGFLDYENKHLGVNNDTRIKSRFDWLHRFPLFLVFVDKVVINKQDWGVDDGVNARQICIENKKGVASALTALVYIPCTEPNTSALRLILSTDTYH